MDSNKALAEMLEIVHGIDVAPSKANSAMDIFKFVMAFDKVDRLCELVKLLDEHMCAGGELPDSWRQTRRSR